MIEFIIALIFLSLATITDIKTREVPDKISFGLLIVAMIYRIGMSFFTSFQFFLDGFYGLVIFFAIGYSLYRLNQWGGADTKILSGLGFLFGVQNLNSFMVGFFVNLFLVGAIISIIYTIYYAIKHRHTLKFKKVKHFDKMLYAALAITLIVLVMFDYTQKLLKITVMLILIVILGSIQLINFLRVIEKQIMIKFIPVSKLTEGDWVAKDIKVGKKIIARKKDNGLTLEQIKLLKKSKLTKVLIKEGIPFLPSFLISLIVTFFVGNILLLLI